MTVGRLSLHARCGRLNLHMRHGVAQGNHPLRAPFVACTLAAFTRKQPFQYNYFVFTGSRVNSAGASKNSQRKQPNLSRTNNFCRTKKTICPCMKGNPAPGEISRYISESVIFCKNYTISIKIDVKNRFYTKKIPFVRHGRITCMATKKRKAQRPSSFL